MRVSNKHIITPTYVVESFSNFTDIILKLPIDICLSKQITLMYIISAIQVCICKRSNTFVSYCILHTHADRRIRITHIITSRIVICFLSKDLEERFPSSVTIIGLKSPEHHRAVNKKRSNSGSRRYYQPSP